MAQRSPVWQVVIHYTDGSTQVETDVRNFTSAGAEKLIATHCADTTKTIAQITATATGAKFSGEE